MGNACTYPFVLAIGVCFVVSYQVSLAPTLNNKLLCEL